MWPLGHKYKPCLTKNIRVTKMQVQLLGLFVLLAMVATSQAAPAPTSTSKTASTAPAPTTAAASKAVPTPAAVTAKAGNTSSSAANAAAKASVSTASAADAAAKASAADADAKASAAVAAAAAAKAATNDPAPVMSYLQKNNFTSFLALLEVLDVTLDSSNGNIVGTWLVPTNKAIDSFTNGMGLANSDLSSRELLVDRVASYHFMPGYTLSDFTKQVPTAAAGTRALTGDVNYVWRVQKDGSGKVSIVDAQNNSIPVSKPPVVINKLAIIPVDSVIMSGGYFSSPTAALKYYPDWTTAGQLLAASGAAVDSGKGDLTFFVPGNAAAKTVTATQAADALANHIVKPSVQFPTWAKAVGWPAVSGKFIGLSSTPVNVVLPWTVPSSQTTPVKLVTLVPEAGAQVNISIYNIYVGKAIYHGVTGLLFQTAPAAAAKPAGRRLRGADAAADLAGEGVTMRRSLHQAFVTTAKVPAYTAASGGAYQVYPNFFSGKNTAAAVRAAGDKSMANWKAGWNSTAAPTAGCFNCGFFVPK